MWTRRALLRHLAGSGAALWGASMLVGCDDGGSAGGAGGMGGMGGAGGAGGAGGMAGPDMGMPDAALVDSEGRWWLSGNYAPVADEIEAVDLEIEGALPPELNGLYVRNGSNPKSGEASHWFLGDGMLHGVRLQDGKALWYRNRYVHTPLYTDMTSGSPVPTIEDNASNVSLVHHAGTLMTLGEVGLPYQIDPNDLSTIGRHDFGGQLSTAMTAHPKIDPVTGELYFFGYWFLPPYLTWHVADASGALVKSEQIEIPASIMMHDFAITERHVIFMDLPVLFDFGIATAGGSFPFRWDDDHGARLGVMTRDGGPADLRWFDIDPCYVFHVLNAWDDGDTVSLIAMRHPELWRTNSEDFSGQPQLWQWRIDLSTGTVSEAQLHDLPAEFPMIDPRRVGRRNRYGYAVGGFGYDPQAPLDNDPVLVRYDLGDASQTTWNYGANYQAGEALFVPAGPDEADGWLLSYVYDTAENRSEVVVLAANDITAGPVARIKLPRRVPHGFHAKWIPAEGT